MIIKSRKTLGPVPQDVSFTQLIFGRMPLWPNRAALIDGISGQRYTYRDLQTLVNKFADGLQKRGIGRTDRICIMAPNCLEHIIAILAVPAIGAIISGLNPTYTAGEVIRQINDTDAKLFIVCPWDVDKIEPIKKSCPTVKDFIVIGRSTEYTMFEDVLNSGADQPITARVNSREDVAMLPYSSGTTGIPKGVMITHHNINASFIGLGPEGICHFDDGIENDLLVFPLYHMAAVAVCLLPGLYCGATHIVYAKFDFEQFLGAVSKYKVTWTALPPPVLVRLSKDPLVKKYDLSPLRSIVVGAAPVAVEVNHAVNRLMPNCCIRQAYGMTENTGVCHYTEPGKPKVGSAGPPVPGIEYKVVDPVTRKMLGPGEDGEIEVRGEYVMKGYWKRPDATAITIDSQGWQKTGDIGHYDEDGFVYLVDRIKDLIKYKAFQVAPAEMEALLLTHPDVADAAVVGVPDEDCGELPRAFVVRKPNTKVTEAELYNYAKERTAPFKRLRGGVVIVNEIPKNPSGKLLRRVLRDRVTVNIKTPRSKY